MDLGKTEKRMLGLGFLVLISIPIVLPLVWGRPIVEYVLAHPTTGTIASVSGLFLVLVGFVLMKVGIERGWYVTKHVVPVGTPRRKGNRVVHATVYLLFGLGAVLIVGTVGVIRAYPVAEDLLFPRFFLGIVLFLAGFAITQEVVVVAPARRNADLLLKTPDLVTSIAKSSPQEGEALRVLYQPSFLIGTPAVVTIDGKGKGSVLPGGALGLYLTPGDHLVTVTTLNRGDASALRAQVTLVPGQSTTLVLPGSRASSLDSIVLPGEVRFRKQVPDGSSKHTVYFIPQARSLGTVSSPLRVKETVAQPLSDTEIMTTKGLSESPAEQPVYDATLEPDSESLIEREDSKFGQAIRAFNQQFVETVGAGSALGSPGSDSARPRHRGSERLPLVLVVAGSVLASLALSWVLASSTPPASSGDDSLTFLILLGCPVLVCFGLMMEFRRIVGLAPVRTYPGGLLMIALGVILAVSDLIRLSEVSSLPRFWLLVFTSSLILFLWWIDPRYGPQSTSRRRHARRQRSWEASPRLASAVAGRATGSTGAIRFRIRSLDESRLFFGPVGSGDLYLLTDLLPVALFLRPGTHRIRLIHECGAATVVAVEVRAGQVVPVTIGHPPGRFLGILPRRRHLYARVGEPVAGAIELSSG